MGILNKIVSVLSVTCLFFMAGCSADAIHENTETGTPVLLAATAGDGGSLETRAVEDAHTGEEQALDENAKLYLRIQGNWPQKSETPIVWTGNVKAGAPTSDGKKNPIVWSSNPKWEYFGTEDPENTVGIKDGLTIYATGIGDFTTDAPQPVEGDWNTFEWVLPTSGTWTQMMKTDLLYSSNIATTPGEGTYKYADHTEPRLIRMRHAMSRVTVNIKAGDGFAGNEFQNDPVVYLTSNRDGETEREYAYTKGRVNIPSQLVTPDDGSERVITMANEDGTGHGGDKIYTYKAFIFPGSHLKRPDDSDIQVKIVVDGATYYVKAEKMNLKMMANPHKSPVTKQGHNYLWTVTINKQTIKVEASVLKWNDVESDVDEIIVH